MLSKTAHFPFRFLPFLKVKAFLTSTDSDFYLYYIMFMHLVMVPQIMPLFILLRVFYIRYQKNGFLYQKLWFIVGSFRKNAYLCKKLLGLNVIK